MADFVANEHSNGMFLNALGIDQWKNFQGALLLVEIREEMADSHWWKAGKKAAGPFRAPR